MLKALFRTYYLFISNYITDTMQVCYLPLRPAMPLICSVF